MTAFLPLAHLATILFYLLPSRTPAAYLASGLTPKQYRQFCSEEQNWLASRFRSHKYQAG